MRMWSGGIIRGSRKRNKPSTNFGSFSGEPKTNLMKSQLQQSPEERTFAGDGAHVLLAGSRREMRPGAQVLGVADPDEWLELTIKLRRKKALPEPAGGN